MAQRCDTYPIEPYGIHQYNPLISTADGFPSVQTVNQKIENFINVLTINVLTNYLILNYNLWGIMLSVKVNYEIPTVFPITMIGTPTPYTF